MEVDGVPPENAHLTSKVLQPTHLSDREAGTQSPHRREICRLWTPDSGIRAGNWDAPWQWLKLLANDHAGAQTPRNMTVFHANGTLAQR